MKLNENWFYIGGIALLLNSMYIAYASQNRWVDGYLYSFADSSLLLTLFIWIIVTILIVTYSLIGMVGMSKVAFTSFLSHFVITLGTWYDITQLPIPLLIQPDIQETVLGSTFFAGDPIGYVLFFPITLLLTSLSVLPKIVRSTL